MRRTSKAGAGRHREISHIKLALQAFCPFGSGLLKPQAKPEYGFRLNKVIKAQVDKNPNMLS